MAKIEVTMVTKDSMVAKFKYNRELMTTFQKIPGAKWLPVHMGGPGWKFTLDMTTCKRLRETFGEGISFSEDILEWGRAKEAERQRLENLSLAESAEDSELLIVQEKLPEMWRQLRPYQKAGIQFIAHSKNPLVADEPGLGKTWEVIGGIYQAKLDAGPNLVVCPKISIENVWLYELSRFQEHAVFVAPEGRKQRERLLEEVEFCLEVEEPFWLIVNPAMLTYRKNNNGEGIYDAKTGMYFDTQFPFIMRTKWNTITMDEAHMSGIANPSSQTARAVRQLNVSKRIATTGTPAGGKATRLWGILHWLEPKEFTSRTRWSDQWLKRKEFTDAQGRTHVDYTGMQAEHEAKFYKAHAQYILRRKKTEVYSEMPEKQFMDVWVHMDPKQEAQYKLMEKEADVRLGEAEDAGKFSATNMLATYSWLKQFANAYCDVVERDREWNDEIDDWVIKYKAMPTPLSPKLEALMQILEELDVPNGDEQVVVFTQFSRMADMIEEYLIGKGIPTAKITGAVSSRQKRSEIQTQFQAGVGAKAVVMTTKAGGVSINLDMANTVVFIDETWDPDEQTQASDRVHRASRIHQVTVYTIRTKGTIEERIQKLLKTKTQINEVLLDVYRRKDEVE